ncbi:hypothetical protein [Methylibium sp.]|uniref:hypothetical protein n=1 Tax=Methylibium sp. TaxID=2067992 RepID=UPI003D0CA1F8
MNLTPDQVASIAAQLEVLDPHDKVWREFAALVLAAVPEARSVATAAAKISRGFDELVQHIDALPSPDELRQQVEEIQSTLEEVKAFVLALIELLGIPLESDSEAILGAIRDLKQRAERPTAGGAT